MIIYDWNLFKMFMINVKFLFFTKINKKIKLSQYISNKYLGCKFGNVPKTRIVISIEKNIYIKIDLFSLEFLIR